MNREKLGQLIDSVPNDDSEIFESLIKEVTLEKVRERLGQDQPLTEVGDIKITNNDVFVSGKKVGTVNLDDDEAVVEFTDTEGDSHTFEDTESLYRYLSGINESNYHDEKNQNSYKARHAKYKKDKKERMKVVKNANDKDMEVGDYTKKDPRGSEHKDPRKENPKAHDHGHDDPSGSKQDNEKSGEGSLPEDKKHKLKNSKHKDDRMENPAGHDHGHDDKSGIDPKDSKKSSGGSNPPDKEHELKGSKHKDSRMENPSKHDHGHDDPSGTGQGK